MYLEPPAWCGFFVVKVDNYEATGSPASCDAYMRLIVGKELIDIVRTDAGLRFDQNASSCARELNRKNLEAERSVL